MADFGGRRDRGSGRAARTVVVIATLLIPVVAIALALRSGGDDEQADAATTVAPASSTTSTGAPTDTQAATTTTVENDPDDGSSTTTPVDTTATTPIDSIGSAATRRTTLLTNEAGAGAGIELTAGSVVMLTGDVSLVDGATWFASSHEGATGWTPAADLELATTGFDARECAVLPDGPTDTPLAYRPGTTEGTADGVIAVETHASSECVRTVLLLGSLGDGSVSAAFPDDIGIVDFGSHLRVDVGGAAHAPELNFTELPDGGVALIARTDDDSKLVIDRGPSRVAVSFLARPARIVVDSEPVDDTRPAVGGGVVLSAQSIIDARDAGDGEVVSMRGWARLSGGLGEIAFRQDPGDNDRGSGIGFPVIFSGTSGVGTVERSWYFYETDRPGTDWSQFQFQISGLSPGSYEMFLGLGGDGNIPDDIEPDDAGLFQLLVVN